MNSLALRHFPAITGLLLISLGGCAAPEPVHIGMREKAFLRSTSGAQLIGAPNTAHKVWKWNDEYYTFKDGELMRISGKEQNVQVFLGPEA